jgi:hypothetical protein
MIGVCASDVHASDFSPDPFSGAIPSLDGGMTGGFEVGLCLDASLDFDSVAASFASRGKTWTWQGPAQNLTSPF